MSEMTWIIDTLTGDLLVEGDGLEEVPTVTRDLLPGARDLGCARPLTLLPPPLASEEEIAGSTCVRIAGYYHNSLMEGPGRRSSVLFQFCPLRCKGCWTPYLHPPHAGQLVPVDRLAAALLDPAYERDGISILGGEPMAQPEGLLTFVRALRARGCPHILCYSGYTYEALRGQARERTAIGEVLDEIDVLVDGPFVEALTRSAGPWTGSGNQRIIDLVATRQTGRMIRLAQPDPTGAEREIT